MGIPLQETVCPSVPMEPMPMINIARNVTLLVTAAGVEVILIVLNVDTALLKGTTEQLLPKDVRKLVIRGTIQKIPRGHARSAQRGALSAHMIKAFVYSVDLEWP